MTKHPELPLAKRVQKKGLPYLLLLPAMALFVAFTFYPFVKTIVLSFALTDKQGNFTKWIGINNWIRILGKESFWQTILVTLKMAAINLTGLNELAIFMNTTKNICGDAIGKMMCQILLNGPAPSSHALSSRSSGSTPAQQQSI